MLSLGGKGRRNGGEKVEWLWRLDDGDGLEALRQKERLRASEMSVVEGMVVGTPRHGSATGGTVSPKHPESVYRLRVCHSTRNSQPSGCVDSCHCQCGVPPRSR
jgi:hypothetical protein